VHEQEILGTDRIPHSCRLARPGLRFFHAPLSLSNGPFVRTRKMSLSIVAPIIFCLGIAFRLGAPDLTFARPLQSQQRGFVPSSSNKSPSGPANAGPYYALR
jgi:hypothetical protein